MAPLPYGQPCKRRTLIAAWLGSEKVDGKKSQEKVVLFLAYQGSRLPGVLLPALGGRGRVDKSNAARELEQVRQ